MTEYILNEVKPFTLKSNIKSALNVCENLPISHIPVVENDRLIGNFLESDIQTITEDNVVIGDYLDLLDFFYVNDDISLLELIKQFADHDCNLIPVLNKEKKYLGYFELSDILDLFSSYPFIHEHGTILIVEKLQKDYSMSEVTQIVESNGGKIMGSFISKHNGQFTQITVKVISEDINEIIQTFRRYDYNVLSNHEDDNYLQELIDRSEYLQKYLDM